MKDKFTEGLSDVEGSFFSKAEQTEQAEYQAALEKARAAGLNVDKLRGYPTEYITDVVEGKGLMKAVHDSLVRTPAPQAIEKGTLPTGSQERKDIPMVRGLLDYFPAALAEVARLSCEGNRKHNPDWDRAGQLGWSRDKSTDHADCILRHLVERGEMDTDGFLHDVKVAWRALAQLQVELEKRGAKKARGAR